MIALVFEDFDFFLHDVFVEVHFLYHFFDHSLRIFAGCGLGSGFHSTEELVFFLKVVFFEGDFAEFFFEFLEFSLFVIESVGPLVFEGLEFEFLLIFDFLDFDFLAFGDLLDGDFEFALTDAELIDLGFELIDLFLQLFVVISKLIFLHHDFIDGFFETGDFLLKRVIGCG